MCSLQSAVVLRDERAVCSMRPCLRLLFEELCVAGFDLSNALVRRWGFLGEKADLACLIHTGSAFCILMAVDSNLRIFSLES